MAAVSSVGRGILSQLKQSLKEWSKGKWPPQRILIARKTSRLEYERLRYSHMADSELKEMLAAQGSDYAGLLLRHRQHSLHVEKIILYLQRQGVEVLVRDKETLGDSDIQWSELVLAAGGDGNFLRTASKVHTQNKMVVGINTDPSRSEGFLCVRQCSSHSVEHVLNSLLSGHFEVLYRQRIQVELSDQQLPYLALNEVFIGEKDPSHMCYHEVCVDSGQAFKQRSSGVLVYTGTGSTSWAYNVHKTTPHVVQKIASLLREAGLPHMFTSLETAKNVAAMYNKQCVFPSDSDKVAYVVREPLNQFACDSHNTTGLCSSLSIRSRSWNSRIIIDGQVEYEFPNGAVAHFSTNPSNALVTCRELQ